MTIIRDWLRMHPTLTLTRDQEADLEKLIDEDIGEIEGESSLIDDYDEDAFGDKCFKLGAKAMRKEVVEHFNDNADACGKTLGLDTALGVIADAIDKMALPETPESWEEETI